MDDDTTTRPPDTNMMYKPEFYRSLNNNLFHGESEKSFVDKLLGRQDADKLHDLVKKEPLTRGDVEEILFLMTSIDQKIVNYNEWDRYVIVKLFPWVKDFSTACKTMLLYEEQYVDHKFTKEFNDTTVLLETLEIIKEINKYLQHNLKFLISVFLLICNSTLSINGAAFETLTTSKFEYSYPSMSMPLPQDRRAGFNFFNKKK